MPTLKSNLNYFLALLISGSMLALWLVAPFLAILFISSGMVTNGITLANALAITMVFVLLLLTWKRNGTLLPSAIKSGAESRCRTGNVILAIANSIVALSLLVSIVGSIFINNFGLAIGFIIAGALLLAVPSCIAGIICVETSRLRKPAIPASLKP